MSIEPPVLETVPGFFAAGEKTAGEFPLISIDSKNRAVILYLVGGLTRNSVCLPKLRFFMIFNG